MQYRARGGKEVPDVVVFGKLVNKERPAEVLREWRLAVQTGAHPSLGACLDALAGLGAPAVPRMIEALKYKKFRLNVVYALGRMGPAAAPATSELAKLVGDENSRLPPGLPDRG